MKGRGQCTRSETCKASPANRERLSSHVHYPLRSTPCILSLHTRVAAHTLAACRVRRWRAQPRRDTDMAIRLT